MAKNRPKDVRMGRVSSSSFADCWALPLTPKKVANRTGRVLC